MRSSRLALAPAESVRTAPIVLLTVLATLLTALAVVTLSRRDMK